MYDLTTMHVVASDRMADAQRSAELHRQRVALRADVRSVLASTLQRLAMRLDARACNAAGASGPTSGSIATRHELCRAA